MDEGLNSAKWWGIVTGLGLGLLTIIIFEGVSNPVVSGAGGGVSAR